LLGVTNVLSTDRAVNQSLISAALHKLVNAYRSDLVAGGIISPINLAISQYIDANPPLAL